MAANYCGQIVGTRRRCASLPTNREQPSSRTLNPRRQRAAKRNEIDLVSPPLPPVPNHGRPYAFFMANLYNVSSCRPDFRHSPPPHHPFPFTIGSSFSYASFRNFIQVLTEVGYSALVCLGRESLGKKRANSDRRPGDITGTMRENRFSGRPAETERAEPHQPSRARE